MSSEMPAGLAAPGVARQSFVGRAARQGGAVVLLTVLLAAAGTFVFPTLPSSIFPPLQFPRIVVIAHSGTLPARSMMLTVTRHLEQAIREVPGIRRVRSKTFRGAAELSAQFEPSTNMDIALQQLQSRIAEARAGISGELDLTVERLTPTSFPVLSLILTGRLPIADLRDYAFYVVRPALSRVPGVGRVEVQASDTREIEVVADPARLTATGLTVKELSAALAAANQLAPVGRYAAAGEQHLVLVSGLWSSVRGIADTPVAVRKGTVIRVADVATVFPGAPDRTALATGNGQDAVLINVSQQINTDILTVKAGVEQALSGDISSSLPSGLRISKVYDLAEFVATAIANVRDAILIGGLLAVFVLVAFLGDWRMTLISALTLPLTVLSTFLFMRLFGESINLMSMGGLAVAIGLVIDDAVVVVENIHRRIAAGGGQGGQPVEDATAELVAPVVGSTLTTVVVLAPLGLLSGVVGQFFRALSLTLSVAVLISLALALTLIPLLSRWVYLRRRQPPSASSLAPAPPAEVAHHAGPRWVQGLDRFYARSLAAAMGRPWLAMAAAAVLAITAVLAGWRIPSGFLPQMDEGGFVIDYRSPSGTAIQQTDRLVRRVERIVAATPEVASFSRRTGSELGLFATEQNKGDVLIRLKPRSQRSRSAEEVIADLRLRVHEAVPELDVEFAQILQDMIGDLEGASTPIEVKIFGDDPDVLARLAGEVQPLVEKVQGVVDLVGVQRGNPEVTWQIDPVAAGRIGLTVDQVASQVSASWLGDVATQLRLLDRMVPVRVRFPDRDRLEPARLAATPVRGADGSIVPLSALGKPVSSHGQSILTRENLRQMAMLTARLEGRDLGGAVGEIKSRLAALRLPVGYSVEVGGQYESQRQSFQELLMVFAISASLVLVVLMFQFRHFLPAILLLAAAPLSLGGAFLLVWAAGSELNVSSAMGLILLVGLVVKNGIVMLDYAHRLHAAGQPLREAIATAAGIRLRPILMTTLCTLFGLLPLALGLGAGAELQKPLALAVIGGLGLSTLVTLYALPSIYAALRGRAGKSPST
ncbi:MAG TPA: efflux RND transporter permease subunit [Thermoanaerobaculia bacterium]|nr:efflux RND transporter permease subunit [Thermoanaerobaculia bacterium]